MLIEGATSTTSPSQAIFSNSVVALSAGWCGSSPPSHFHQPRLNISPLWSWWDKQFYSTSLVFLQGPLTIFTDNQGAILFAKGPTRHHLQTKHFDIHHHFIQKQVKKGAIQLEHCPTTSMIADMLTKALPHPQFKSCNPLPVSAQSSRYIAVQLEGACWQSYRVTPTNLHTAMHSGHLLPLWYAIFGLILFGSVLKLFDPSLKIRGPVVVKRAEFIRNWKVRTLYVRVQSLIHSWLLHIVHLPHKAFSLLSGVHTPLPSTLCLPTPSSFFRSGYLRPRPKLGCRWHRILMEMGLFQLGICKKTPNKRASVASKEWYYTKASNCQSLPHH